VALVETGQAGEGKRLLTTLLQSREAFASRVAAENLLRTL
jgi:hypothetical protein